MVVGILNLYLEYIGDPKKKIYWLFKMRAVHNPRRRYISQEQVNNTQPFNVGSMQEHLVCDSMCNIPCEQINLVQEMYPKTIRPSDQNVTVTIVATNTGSQTITQPIVVVSSLLGTFLISNTGLNPGETRTISRTYNISGVPFPSNMVTNVSYAAYGIVIPGGYAPGERLSKVITTSSEFQSSPTGGVSINSSGEIINAGAGMSIITMSFTVTSSSAVTSISVPLAGIIDTTQGISVLRNPNNMFQIMGNNLVLAPGGNTLNPGVRYVIVIEGVIISSNPYCNEQSCVLTYTASSSTSTNPNLTMILNKTDNFTSVMYQ